MRLLGFRNLDSRKQNFVDKTLQQVVIYGIFGAQIAVNAVLIRVHMHIQAVSLCAIKSQCAISYTAVNHQPKMLCMLP